VEEAKETAAFCCDLFLHTMADKLRVVELKLFVYVIRLGSSSFPIRIQSSDTVDDLKKAIFEEKRNKLANLNAGELTLYRVELEDDEDTLERSATDPLLTRERLKPTRQLSKVFPNNVPLEKVNILVELPEGYQEGKSYEIFRNDRLLITTPLLSSYFHMYRHSNALSLLHGPSPFAHYLVSKLFTCLP
jgi:hypothetical protein